MANHFSCASSASSSLVSARIVCVLSRSGFLAAGGDFAAGAGGALIVVLFGTGVLAAGCAALAAGGAEIVGFVGAGFVFAGTGAAVLVGSLCKLSSIDGRSIPLPTWNG